MIALPGMVDAHARDAVPRPRPPHPRPPTRAPVLRPRPHRPRPAPRPGRPHGSRGVRAGRPSGQPPAPQVRHHHRRRPRLPVRPARTRRGLHQRLRVVGDPLGLRPGDHDPPPLPVVRDLRAGRQQHPGPPRPHPGHSRAPVRGPGGHRPRHSRRFRPRRGPGRRARRRHLHLRRGDPGRPRRLARGDEGQADRGPRPGRLPHRPHRAGPLRVPRRRRGRGPGRPRHKRRPLPVHQPRRPCCEPRRRHQPRRHQPRLQQVRQPLRPKAPSPPGSTSPLAST